MVRSFPGVSPKPRFCPNLDSTVCRIQRTPNKETAQHVNCGVRVNPPIYIYIYVYIYIYIYIYIHIHVYI